MKSRLNARARARWDALIGTEGKTLGLDGCRSFLENTHVNDIFYGGRFKGVPCIVKCSSRAPDSILNEAAVGRRLFGADPAVFPEILADFKTADGKMAIVVTRRIEGPSFYELVRQPGGIPPAQSDAFAEDVLRIAAALHKTGIVHRDINQKNLLLDSDGHLKLIDFQFAIDRNAYRETAFMRRNWKYLHVVFGMNRELGVGRWDDIPPLIYILSQLPPTETTRNAVKRLEGLGATSMFSAPVPPAVFLWLRLHAFSLRLRLLLHPSGERSDRLRYRLKTVMDAIEIHCRERGHSA